MSVVDRDVRALLGEVLAGRVQAGDVTRDGVRVAVLMSAAHYERLTAAAGGGLCDHLCDHQWARTNDEGGYWCPRCALTRCPATASGGRWQCERAAGHGSDHVDGHTYWSTRPLNGGGTLLLGQVFQRVTEGAEHGDPS